MNHGARQPIPGVGHSRGLFVLAICIVSRGVIVIKGQTYCDKGEKTIAIKATNTSLSAGPAPNYRELGHTTVEFATEPVKLGSLMINPKALWLGTCPSAPAPRDDTIAIR